METTKKRKAIDSSTSLTHIPKYDTRGSIHVTKDAQKSCDSCDLCKDVMSITLINPVDRCIHAFCTDCLQTYLAKEVRQNIHEVKCPEPKCKVTLPIQYCSRYVPEQVFDRWNTALIESSALAEYRMIMCPFDDCRSMFADDGKRCITRACPDCCRLFCKRCKVEWHEKMSCAMFRRSRGYEFQTHPHNSHNHNNMIRRRPRKHHDQILIFDHDF